MATGVVDGVIAQGAEEMSDGEVEEEEIVGEGGRNFSAVWGLGEVPRLDEPLFRNI